MKRIMIVLCVSDDLHITPIMFSLKYTVSYHYDLANVKDKVTYI